MNSDISKRTSDFSLPNMNCASVRTTSVLPTPVGPRKRNEPMGRFGFFRPARERRMARAKAVIALSCEITRLCNSSSMRSNFCDSSSLIDEIDCLIGQEAVRNIPSGMRYGEVDSVVSVSNRVELLVAVLNAEQNLGGIAFIRRRNLDGLETALQRTVFLDRLAILARRSRADTLNFTARQSRFQDVGRV